jgi:hypothetical protein
MALSDKVGITKAMKVQSDVTTAIPRLILWMLETFGNRSQRVCVLVLSTFSDLAAAGVRSTALEFSFRRNLLVRSAFRRDAPVASAAPRWIIHSASSGVTGMPLRYGLDTRPLILLIASPENLTHIRSDTNFTGDKRPITDQFVGNL